MLDLANEFMLSLSLSPSFFHARYAGSYWSIMSLAQRWMPQSHWGIDGREYYVCI